MLKSIRDTFLSRSFGVLLLAYLAGGSTALAFAPYNLWPIYPLALAFTLWLMPHRSTRAAFSHWLSFGFGAFSIGISWVHVSMDQYGGIPLVGSLALMLLLALYLALYPAIAGALLYRLAPKPGYWRELALFPALWTLTEWARGWVLTGFPWLWAGYTQTDGPLRPLASIIGTLGLSFVLALLAGALLLSLRRRWQPLAIALPVLALLVYLVPSFNHLEPRGKSVKVALVQGNIPQSLKWEPEHLWPTMVKYMDLTRPVLDSDIVIWPEAAVPAPDYMVKDYLDNANKVANLNHAAIVTGIISYRHQQFYNSLIVLGNEFAKQEPAGDFNHDGKNQFFKHHLLPIGEFVPFEDLLRPIAPLFNLPMSSFARGPYLQPNLSALGYHLAPAICYEIAFPEQVRDSVHNSTDMLLTVSNDAWFGASNGPLQHMEIARMRAVELGRPLLRSTNNGVTAVVDYQGNIIASLPQFEAGVLTAKVPLVRGMTWFNRLGEWPILMFSVCLLILTLARRLQLRRR
ncbi:apolipoprotein N-acyltransferase [Shewanella sp. NFH-SH190041]|uniref:apolipoprotein N-acyltransferase n=1 Tax=Shewanella sp. NFH-SH190041 TaxID=2950245 RepID=UPI0021C36C1F|nr:apolipoprotein N-acyltransferase [Shewanella sp. NFH-SH190041]BDM65644.1 apolipoprotein N-acyltransferase [Shewanella sp. NFH-SH190041]